MTAQTPRILVAWSGGKDSALALWQVLADRSADVCGLVTTVTATYDRVSMHGIRRDILHAQAAALELPVIESSIAANAANSDYERAFAGGIERARHETNADRVIAFGDLFLEDVRQYREQLLAHHGWTPVFPLWERDTGALARTFIDAGFRAILCCIDTQQLSGDFAGREFDDDLLRDLPHSVDPCGERGEFHTCVYAGPIFRAPIPLVRGATVLRDDRFAYCDLLTG